ncbi:MAG: glycosyltransferase family 4 protein [Chloroflexi bacterium]|nr:glycosyltransferase family 4 protein [Chloroflexota bacterium]
MTIMNCPRHHKSGMPTANASLTTALERLGCRVEQVYLEDLPGRDWGKLNQLAFGFKLIRLVETYEKKYGSYDAIEVSGGDGWCFAWLKKFLNKNCLLIARSHGLEHRYWQTYLAEVAAGREKVTPQHRFYFGRLRLKQVEWSIRTADYFRSLSQADANYVIERGWIKPEQIIVLPNAVSDFFFQPELKAKPFTGRLLFSGNWTWVKGNRLLVEVFKRLAQRHPALQLSIVGCNMAPAKVQAYFPPELWSRIRIEPGLDHSQMAQEFANHDLLLFLSLFEGYGTIVTEAMAGGLPVVGARVGCVPELIREGETGFSVNPGEVEGFVQAVETLLNNPEVAQHIRVQAREAVKTLRWELVAKEILTAYRGN